MFKSALVKTSTSIITVLTALLLIMVIVSGLTTVVHAAAPPGMPHQFYGTVKNNGALVGAGYQVVVRTGTAQLGAVSTDSLGKYGYDPLLLVPAQSGQLIDFYVNGVKAAQTATFSAGGVNRLDLTVTGAPASAPPSGSCGITTASLASATVGTAYSTTLAASGGTTPYTWSRISGSLPAGLTIGSGGVISGTPTAAQTYSFTVQANDSAAHTCIKALSILVNAATPAATVASISASILGGTDTFSLSNGVLSAAKSLSSSDGRVKLDLAANTSINMQGLTQLGAATESNPQAASDNSTLIRAYSFVPSGATFSPAATMTLKYETAALPAGVTESGLYIAFWNGTAWERLNSTVNSTLKEVSAPVAHFTVFSIRYAPPATTTSTTTTTTTTTTPTTTDTTTITTPTPTSATSTTITANVLGTSGSFSMSNGTVPSATSLSSSNGRMGISLAANTAVSLPAGSQQITAIQLAQSPTPPANSKVIEAYSFGPDNTTFSPAASVTVKYDPATLPADVQESNLYLALLENSSWTEIPCTVDAVAKTVTAQVSHFSTYALLGRVTMAPATPAAPGTPETPTTPVETPATTPAAPGSSAASDMSTLVLVVIVAGGLLVIVLAIILIMRQRSSGY